MDSVVPQLASVTGGTIVTITGRNFGTEKTDNPVQISFNGGVGSTNCFVLVSTPTEIKCQIDKNIAHEDGKSGELVVFLKTSEEATCVEPNCEFAFTSEVPTVNLATP